DHPEPNPWDHYQDFGHSHWHNGLIWGEHLENIAILGPGEIYGKGLTRNHKMDHLPQGLGDKSIALKDCHNVLLRDFSILHGGHFGILVTGVDNLTIEDLRIDTNRDGMDIDACHQVRITGCHVNSPWDDGICIKSSYALGYKRASEDLTISDCIVSGYQEGSMLDGSFQLPQFIGQWGATGRIKLGTESNGGFKNITITNCVFDHCHGLALETVDGGNLEDITISNITMRHIVNAPIFLRLGSRLRGPAGIQPGRIRRVIISNVVVSGANSRTGCVISGIPGHDIEDIDLHHIRIQYLGGGTRKQAHLHPPEKEAGYPGPDMFGVLPSYGFFIRHARGIRMSDIHISYSQEDLRPAFVLNQVKDAVFRHIRAEHARGIPVFRLSRVKGFRVDGGQRVSGGNSAPH
ncbi:MAG: rhamnogalacturonidase, partial [Chitinophagaceae bacterium]